MGVGLWVVACGGSGGGGSDATTEASTTAATAAATAETAGTAATTVPSPTSSTDPTTSGTSTTGPTPGTADDTTVPGTSDSDTEGEPAYGCEDMLVFANDFDDDAVGAYADLSDWNDPPWDDGVGEGRVEIIEGGMAYEGRSLRVHYPQGGVGPGEGGAQWRLQLDGSYDELYLAYRVRFGDGFDFVLGGKLPGLVGGSSPTGCVDDTEGFSARSMWRTEGNGVQYMYFPEKVNACGDDYDYMLGDAPARFMPGEWHTLEHRLVMNTPGEYDGVLQAWLDGEPVLDESDFLFRLADGTFSIDTMYFSTFFGGSTPEWGPVQDEVVDFDEFVICTGPISH